MVSRDRLIAYLLHQIPEEERLDFAGEWFADQDLCDELTMVEAELFDGYARGTLPEAQRELVAKFLLTSEEQRRKLNFATTLGTALAKPQPPARRMPWLALAAALIVGLAGVMAWMAVQNHHLRGEIANERASAARPAPDGAYTASLAPQDLRGASREPVVQVPPGAGMLRLELELPEGEKRASYGAAVLNGGRRIWREEPVKSQEKEGTTVAVVWIPADILTAGTYTVVLEAEGGPVAGYRVRIAR
jgi:hypothetical protein